MSFGWFWNTCPGSLRFRWSINPYTNQRLGRVRVVYQTIFFLLMRQKFRNFFGDKTKTFSTMVCFLFCNKLPRQRNMVTVEEGDIYVDIWDICITILVGFLWGFFITFWLVRNFFLLIYKQSSFPFWHDIQKLKNYSIWLKSKNTKTQKENRKPARRILVTNVFFFIFVLGNWSCSFFVETKTITREKKTPQEKNLGFLKIYSKIWKSLQTMLETPLYIFWDQVVKVWLLLLLLYNNY